MDNPIVLGAILGAVAGVAVTLVRKGKAISSEDARRLVQEGATLVDVRSPSEFSSGHLPGAVNIPVSELTKRSDEIGKTDTPVVLYCRSGARSSRAKKLLAAAGFSAVHDLGPMHRW